MNKAELIDALAEQTDGLPKTTIATVVNGLFGSIQQELAKGGNVQLIGFGTFATGERAAHTGRHPQTGAPLPIAAAKTIKFTAGKAFKARVNADATKRGKATRKPKK